MRRLLIALGLVSVAAGLTASALWLGSGDVEGVASLRLERSLPILAGVIAATTLNLGLRWLRWHFLTRRFLRTLPTRSSLKLYFGTLLGFATPFYVGELVRSAIAVRRRPGAAGIVLRIWAAERAADAAALGLFLLLAQLDGAAWLALPGLAAVWVALLRPRIARERRRVLVALAGTSVAAWLLPVASLWWVLVQLDQPLPAAVAAEVFALASFLGGLSLLPLGSGVTGSSMIVQLGAAGLGAEPSITAVVLFRAGTAWYALGLGLVALLAWRRELLALARAPSTGERFEALAPRYGSQIAAHVRERVVERKLARMVDWLGATGTPAAGRGLEVGCGHGWYVTELVERGFVMQACDLSRGQVDEARRFAGAAGLHVPLSVADVRRLPYADCSFEFVYAVNVLHHITDPRDRMSALREVVRVLVPGGSFFLHEINTENPLFTFYMGYVFPVLRDIDDGTEAWIRPSRLPPVEGADWDPERRYLTFLPEFTPRRLLERLEGLEARLERSRFRSGSAHFVARLVRRPEPRPQVSSITGSRPSA